MSDQDIFNQNQEGSNQNAGGNPANQNSDNPNGLADLLSTIKNDQGQPKYDSVEKAVNALKASQDFIPQLQDENAQLKEQIATLTAQVEKGKTMDEIVERLSNANQNQEPQNQGNDEALSLEDVAAVVHNALDTRSQQAKENENVQTVVTKMTELFGDEASSKLYETAASQGLSQEQTNQLVRNHPQLILNLFSDQPNGGAGDRSNTVNTPPAGINSQAQKDVPQTKIRRNTESVAAGATKEERKREFDDSKAMVEELHSEGKTMYDLSNPAEYYKHFGF